MSEDVRIKFLKNATYKRRYKKKVRLYTIYA